MNIEMRKYIECTYEEKKSLLKIIEQMIELANLARKEGILSLEEQIEKSDDQFFKTGLSLIVDGTDPDLVKDIMSVKITTSFKTGAELLSQFMIRDGVIAVQAGMNPRIIEAKLLAYLGGEFTSQDIKLIDNIEEDYKKLMSDPDLWVQQEGLPEFESLLNLSNHDIQFILREIDCKDLTIALICSSNELKKHFLSNLSKRLCVKMLTDMKETGLARLPKEDIQAAQQNILDTVKRLQGSGELMSQSELDAILSDAKKE